MKKLLLVLLSVVAFAGVSVLISQTANDLNEGSRVEWDGTNQIWRFKWWGKSGRTYFIQHSEDLINWNWVPVVESGAGAVKEWGFTSTGDKFFLRLQYTDESAADPETADFDGDGIGSLLELQQGSSPLENLDTDNNGLPDDWELFWDNEFAVYQSPLTATLSHRSSTVLPLILNNPVAPDADFTVTVSNNLAGTQIVYEASDNLTGTSVYNWTEISGTGTLLSSISETDNASEEVVLAHFQFPFYGTSYDRVYAASNGLLTFGAPSTDSGNDPIPAPYGPDNFIALFWDDLDTNDAITSDGGAIYYQEFSDRLIIQYEAVMRDSDSDPSTQANTFQAVLHDDGRIEVFYKRMDGYLLSATVGIEDAAGANGVELAYNSAYLQSDLAILYQPSPARFVAVSPLSGNVSETGTYQLDVEFRSHDLPPGIYTANIAISHNGTGTTPWNIPAVLEVENQPTTITITGPAQGAEFWMDEDADIYVTASDPDFGIERVDFYADQALIGTDAAASYRLFNWTPDIPGTYTLTARAVDSFDTETTSTPVDVIFRADSDADRMEDDWELSNFGDLSQEASADTDGDRFPNIVEYHHGTDPADPQDYPVFSTTQNTLSPLSTVGEVNYFIVDGASNTTYEKSSIQSALNAANDFDIIEVLPGIYNEDIRLSERVFLFSRDGARTTILDGTGRNDSVIDLFSESVIDGFTIRNGGSTTSVNNGGGLYVSVSGNQNKLRLIGCLFLNNRATSRGGAIYINAGDPTFISCTLTNNTAPDGRALYSTSGSNDIALVNTLLWNPGTGTGELAGNLTSLTLASTITRDDATGNVLVDGVDQMTQQHGLGFAGSLTAASPARDASAASPFGNPDTDGESRPNGLAPDIGADEFHDSDADGLPDWLEVQGITDPAADHDGDGLSNLDEYQTHRSDPRLTDTDGDGLEDGQEVAQGTDADRADSDFDGLPDGWEVLHGLNPLDPADAATDPDNDGYTNLEEYQEDLDPTFAEDSDGDGIPDGIERDLIYRTPSGGWGFFNINNPDTDGNGTPDGLEDYDLDSLTVLDELTLGTDPNLADTDADGVNDGNEITLGSDPLTPDPWATQDSDNDGLNDLTEIGLGTDPFNPDTNGNGMNDGEELDNGGDPINPGPPPTQLPPPSANPEPPADPAPQPPHSITPGQYDILVEVKSLSFPKYGHATFEVLDPPKRYLTASSTQSFSGGCPESGPLGVSGNKTTTIDPQTGESDSTGDGFVNTGGNVQSPFRRGGSSNRSSYDDPPNEEGDCTGTITYSTTLSSENTTAMMVQNGKGELEAYENDFQPGTPFAYRNVHENELNFAYQKVQFKFKWKDDTTEEQKFPITYLVLFQPEDDPDTEETDESVENAEVVETITWNGESAESQVFSVDPDQRKSGVDGTYRLIVMDVGVDGNRDGTIAFSSPEDQTKQGAPFRFWVNDDEDRDDPDDPENVNTSNPDGDDNQIEAKRDLEDFTRLNVNIGALHEAVAEGTIQVGLKWKETSSGSPQIKVWRNLSPNGGTQYLSDDAVAAEHLNLGNPGHIQGSASYIISTQFWEDAELSASQPFGHLLFEGVEEGKGRLVVTLHDSSGAEIGEGAGVWLDIKNIKKMYQRGKAQPENIAAPQEQSNESTVFTGPTSYVDDPNSQPFEADPDEEDKAVIFVHGWSMDYNSYISFSETKFKRLWHQGYKGRFCGFRWDPLVINKVFDISTSSGEYNRSEHRAWVYGQALKSFAEDIKNDGLSVSLIGHSMGNVVCSSALNQGLSVQNYLLMEAAVPAGCYDESGGNGSGGVNGYVRFWNKEASEPTPDYHQSPGGENTNGYRGYLKGIESNVAGEVVNYHNYLDYALATGFKFGGSLETNWEANQDNYKPDGNPGTNWQYLYDPTITPLSERAALQFNLSVGRFVTHSYEIKSFVARSRSKAVGAVRGTIDNPLPSDAITSNRDLQDIYGFTDDDSDHSGQFNRNSQELFDLYSDIMSIVSP